MTVFIKKHNEKVVKEAMQIWFNTLKNHSKRDQLSFMYAVWKTNLPITPIDLNVWDNPWFTTTKHTPQTFQTKECHVYFGNPDSDFDINKYYTYPYQQTNNTYHFITTIPNNTTEIEFNPTNVIGVKFDNIVIRPTPKRQIISGAMASAFCIDHGIIRVYGDFCKNQKLSFSIELSTPSIADLCKLIEEQWRENSQLTKLLPEISKLQNDNHQLQSELQSIKSSRSWKAINKIHSFIHHDNHPKQ